LYELNCVQMQGDDQNAEDLDALLVQMEADEVSVI
jgi:hypothetical protein